MKKKIWIWNHYATDMFDNKGGRHYWFADNLIKKGYDVTVFCANTYHNKQDVIRINEKKYKKSSVNNISFVFVKTTKYKGNGLDRIKNMFTFYKNLIYVAKKFIKEKDRPDVILASSVHPLTLVAGIKIAKKYKIPCICEVRDLWPESLVAYGLLKRNSLITKLLYRAEKWIYINADSIIMTWEGGKDYIIDKGWDNQIDISKITHISNGLDLNAFDRNSQKYVVSDSDLDSTKHKKVLYTGSIRKVNNLGIILNVAKLIKANGINDIKFIIYGSGEEKEALEERCKKKNIENVIFKGYVEKKFIPSILKKADINILHNTSTSLDKYGQSQNKLFEYLAAGRCIVQTYKTNYSICEINNCGINASEQTENEITNAIIKAYKNDDIRSEMGKNARKTAYEYDFNKLTEKLISVIENVSI